MRTDGGPAFATTEQTCAGIHEGLSKRDWFAGQVLAGYGELYRTGWTPEQLAKQAYAIADAMLKTREPK